MKKKTGKLYPFAIISESELFLSDSSSQDMIEARSYFQAY